MWKRIDRFLARATSTKPQFYKSLNVLLGLIVVLVFFYYAKCILNVQEGARNRKKNKVKTAQAIAVAEEIPAIKALNEKIANTNQEVNANREKAYQIGRFANAINQRDIANSNFSKHHIGSLYKLRRGDLARQANKDNSLNNQIIELNKQISTMGMGTA